jgi:beta-xylosidase
VTEEPPPEACYFAYTTAFWLFLVPVWRSTDLITWTQVIDDTVRGSALADLAPWSEFGGNWAPSVLERPENPPEQRFVLWYTAKEASTGLECLGVAAAATPAGPFSDTATAPAYCQRDQGGTIDPDPFVDDDGTPYLLFKSEGVAFAARTKIWAARLAADGQSIVGGTEQQLLETDPTGWEEPVIEGPNLIRVDGTLQLFYSAYRWQTADYKVGVARCDTPLGPCSRTYATPVLATRGAMYGPGGQTAFRTAAGEWRMVFHAWSTAAGESGGDVRRMRILPLTFPDGNPAIG